MRGQLFLASLALAACAAQVPAAELKPYVAYVNSDDVYIRSGPGKNYYPTAKLKRGEEIEVYRHDPGGWYAIRPPRQSFSWVSARQLDSVGKKLAEVNVDRAVARVGSTFSDVRDVIQVRFNRGDRVELLEDAPVADGKWYKIAPPAGEFRWIYKEYLDREPPAQVASADEPADRDDDADNETDDDSDSEPATRKSKSARSNGDIRLTSGEPAEEAAPRPSSRRRPERVASSTAANPAPVTRAKGRDDDASKSFSKAMADIDLDISAMVVEEPSSWSFEDLRLRSERLLDRAPTALERGQVRLLIGKIDRFAELKDRNDTISKMRNETYRRNLQVGSADQVRHEASLGPRFDASGRLAPVVPRKEGAPPFVLLDPRGRIVAYLTPAPGINLRPYVDRQVGINGQRGFMADLQKGHINVQHVTVLPEVARRQLSSLR